MKTKSGAEPETAAMVGAVIYGICLLQADQAQFLANGLLIAIPMLLTYAYPRERPSTPLLLIYWACLSASTLFDHIFADSVPAFYVFKVFGLCLLFLRPVCGAQKILELLEKNKLSTGADNAVPPVAVTLAPTTTTETEQTEHVPFNADELRELDKVKNKKSPPPEKPDSETKNTSKAAKLLREAKDNAQTDRTQSVRSARSTKSKFY